MELASSPSLPLYNSFHKTRIIPSLPIMIFPAVLQLRVSAAIGRSLMHFCFSSSKNPTNAVKINDGTCSVEFPGENMADLRRQSMIMIMNYILKSVLS